MMVFTAFTVYTLWGGTPMLVSRIGSLTYEHRWYNVNISCRITTVYGFNMEK